jgi:hypothetical protein
MFRLSESNGVSLLHQLQEKQEDVFSATVNACDQATYVESDGIVHRNETGINRLGEIRDLLIAVYLQLDSVVEDADQFYT